MKTRNTTLDDLAAVIGFRATLLLATWYGDNNNLYVPAKADSGQTLVRLIGMASAKRMCEEWGCQHIAIPRAPFEEDMRNRLIGRMFEKGFGSREIAYHLNLGEKRVQQICRHLKGAGLIEVTQRRGFRDVTRVQPAKVDHAESPDQFGTPSR